MGLRETNIDRLSGSTFDVLIVGAGINGAVSAAALASRGAKVAVVDRGDFGCFTSQESSNLVWGGFKYMENYEFLLVRHLCMSRNRLIRAYPSNIREIRFLAALDEHSPYSPQFAGAGAAAYWAIGNCFTKAPRVLSPEAVKREEPVIETSRLRGGLEYSDAYLIDNDSRFVFGFVRSALNVGATAVNYMEVTGAEHHAGMWECQLRDVDTGDEHRVRARVVINATGPYVDPFNRDAKISTSHRIVYSKGIHLVVPRIGRQERVLAFFDDTGRLFYVIPMGFRSVIGTTDTRVGEPETEVTVEDRDFLLDQINKRLALPEPLTPADVISTRCGVRPLVVESNDRSAGEADWTALSRKHAVEIDWNRRFITIFGGKLTDCLNVGKEVYDLVGQCGVALDQYRDDWFGEPPAATHAEFQRQTRLMRLDALREHTGFERLTTRLWRRYGLRAFTMLEAIRDDPSMGEDIIEGAQYLRCELHLAAGTEMVTKLEDFLRRRSKISQVMHHEEIRAAAGLREAEEILFGADADRRHDEYFATHTAPLA